VKFWGLAYKSYADPIALLDGYVVMGCLEDGIVQIIEDSEEEKQWQLYLALQSSFAPLEESFSDWRKSFVQPEPQKPVDIEATVSKSEGILLKFKPKPKG
jgi:hypothetical protein